MFVEQIQIGLIRGGSLARKLAKRFWLGSLWLDRMGAFVCTLLPPPEFDYQLN